MRKLDQLGAENIHKRLAAVYELGVNFASVDITKEDRPVVAATQGRMGGVRTSINGQGMHVGLMVTFSQSYK